MYALSINYHTRWTQFLAVLYLLLLVTPSSTAQIGFGLIGGTNINVENIKSALSVNTLDKVTKESMGYQFGIFTELKLLGITIEPQLMYGKSRYEMNLDGQTSMATSHEFFFPLNVGLQLAFVKVFAGPAFRLSRNALLDDISNLRQRFVSRDFIPQYGIELKLKKWSLQAAYQSNFFRSDLDNNTDQTSGAVSRLSLNLKRYF